MNPLHIIEAKRDGKEHTYADLRAIAEGAAHGTIPDYQLAAWLMAAYLRGLSARETAGLTRALAESGETLDLAGLRPPWIDKHSTGGVGDKTTLVAVPMMAACGATCVKMSGRGLGITGGTVDKLSSIPGFRLDLSTDELLSVGKRIGMALTAQTKRLAPADGVLYALRDVTGTVSSPPLIAASVMSKKLAAGSETIVIDLKCGSGAFMKTVEEAETLGRLLVSAASLTGLRVRVLMTDMNEPLGHAVGNALEVLEAVQCLKGCGEPRFMELCVRLVAEGLVASKSITSLETALERARHSISSGQALSTFTEWIVAQGGDPAFMEEPARLPQSPVIRDVVHDGPVAFLSEMDAEDIGKAVVEMGGGRREKGDEVDLAVGFSHLAKVGQRLAPGELLGRVHARSKSDAALGESAIRQAIQCSTNPVSPPPIVIRTFGG